MAKMKMGSQADTEKWLLIQGHVNWLYNAAQSSVRDEASRKVARERILRLHQLVKDD